MYYKDIILYQLSYIKHDLIILIEKLENNLLEISHDYNTNHVEIQIISEIIANLYKSHLNNDIILQKINEALFDIYNLEFILQFWHTVTIELYNNYLFLDYLYLKIIKYIIYENNLVIKILIQLESIRNTFIRSSQVSNYLYLFYLQQ